MPYESHVTTSAVFDKPAYITYPFAKDGDTATKIVHQPLLQLADRYVPPTLGGVFSSGLANLSGSPVTIGDAYCIGDTEPQPAEAGLVSFTRMWANIPASRSVPTGTTLYQFVGLPAGITGATKTITALSALTASTTITVAAHGYTAGYFVYMAITYTFGGTITVYTTQPIFSVTTDTFTVGPIPYATGVFVSGTVSRGDPYRATYQGKSSTITNYDYALPGVTVGVASAIDFLPSPKFNPIVITTGQSVSDYADFGNVLSEFTSPTAIQYRALIASKALISTESDIAPWMGSILERKTLMVRAL